MVRIELPPVEEIPDVADFEQTEGPAKWTIPHTDITIARVIEGTRKGEFLFSTATVERVREFYQRTRALPYPRDVPLENSAGLRQLHPGWWVAMSTIERLPGYCCRSVHPLDSDVTGARYFTRVQSCPVQMMDTQPSMSSTSPLSFIFDL